MTNFVGVIRVLTLDDPEMVATHGRQIERKYGLATRSRCIPDQRRGIYDAESAPSAVARAVTDAHAGKYQRIVIDSLTTLDARPLAALRLCTVFHELNIEVTVLGQPWISTGLPVLREAMLWVDRAQRDLWAEAVRRGVDAAARAGRRGGRPRRRVDAGALASVGHLSLGEAARQLGLPRTTLRRLLAEQQEAVRAQAPTTQPQWAA